MNFLLFVSQAARSVLVRSVDSSQNLCFIDLIVLVSCVVVVMLVCV